MRPASNLRRSFTIGWAIFTCFLASVALDAQEPEPAEKVGGEAREPATTADPKIPVDRLDLILTPLTRKELELETGAWQELVKAKVEEESRQDIVCRDLDGRIESGEAPEAEASRISEEMKKAVESLAGIREERSALVQRFSTVLDAFEAKGGDATEGRQYVAAVSEIKIEGADATALWATLKGWIVSEEGGLRWGRKILIFLVVMFAFWMLAAVASKMVKRATAMNEGMSDLLKRFLNRMVRRTMIFIGLLVALSTLGINVSALLALMGGGAFIIGFALQDALGNFAAGLMLLIYRPFDVGNSVEVGGVNGSVDSVSLVSTTIRTFDNKVVLVPNKKVWGEVITNATSSDKRRVDMVFGIGYDDDLKEAQRILEEIVSNHELVYEDPEPVIRVNELADSSVNFICRPWCATGDYWTVYWDITRKVKEEFDAQGVSIPFPQQDVHLHQVAAIS